MTRWAWVAAAMPLALSACAESRPAGGEEATEATAPAPTVGVSIAQPWVRDSAGRTGTAAVFMTITAAAGDRVLGGSSPVAEKTDLMTMRAEDGTIGMRYIDAIDLPAGKPVSLDPMGLHVWLEGLKQPLKAGETFPLMLEFERAGRQEVTVSVIEPAAAEPMQGM